MVEIKDKYYTYKLTLPRPPIRLIRVGIAAATVEEPGRRLTSTFATLFTLLIRSAVVIREQNLLKQLLMAIIAGEISAGEKNLK